MKNIVLICCMIALCGCDSDIFGGRKRVDLDRQKWEAEQKERKVLQKERKVLELAERKAQIDILIPEIEYKLAMASNDLDEVACYDKCIWKSY